MEECGVCPHALPRSSRKEPEEAAAMAEVWQARLTNGTGGCFLLLFPFPALLFLILEEDWNKSTEFWFGEVVDDHVE